MSQCPDVTAVSGYRTCEHGCCGDNASQSCCTYALSETVIIVTCVVGALVVIAVVVALVMCLTHKHKDRVTRIRPRPLRDEQHTNQPPRRVAAPKPPPPYREREAPPGYTARTQSTHDSPNVPVVYPEEPAYSIPRYSSLSRADVRQQPTPQPGAYRQTHTIQGPPGTGPIHVHGPTDIHGSRRRADGNTPIIHIPDSAEILQDIPESPRESVHIPLPSRIPRRVRSGQQMPQQVSGDDGLLSFQDIPNTVSET